MMLQESVFLSSAMPIRPRCTEEGVLEKFQFPSPPKPDDKDFEAKKAEFEIKKVHYQDAMDQEFVKFVDDTEPSAIYLAFQPMWSAKTNLLTGLEVLCRIANGKDDAPMPGLAVFQTQQRPTAIRFLKKQTEVAVDACKKLPNIRISVNVRPDELQEVADFLIEKAAETAFDGRPSNLLIEITEYAPIEERTLALIKSMKDQGVVFALDDVTEVVDNPGKGMAKTGTHSCSFTLAKANAELFAVQKLGLPMSCSVFRKKVYPTPEYDGGKANSFLEGMIFAEDQKTEIEKRKLMVEDWWSEVTRRNPDTQFIIECSVYPEDVHQGQNNELYPNIPLFDGRFDIQGGKTGGRAFSLEAFLPDDHPVQ